MHKAHVKEAMISTNRKNWELQIMSLHAKKEAMVHATRQIQGKYPGMNFILDPCLIVLMILINDFY